MKPNDNKSFLSRTQMNNDYTDLVIIFEGNERRIFYTEILMDTFLGEKFSVGFFLPFTIVMSYKVILKTD